MKVSILMATYNRPKQLLRALQSIKNQSYDDYELIIVNDFGWKIDKIVNESGIIDGERRVVLRNNIENMGPTQCFHYALGAAVGDLVVQLDDDDEFTPMGIELMAAHFTKHHDIDAVFCYAIRKRDGKLEIYPPPNYKFTLPNMLQKNWCVSCSRMVKRSVLEKIGFDPSLQVLVDWDINLNLIINYKIKYSNDVVSIVNMSSESWNATHKDLVKNEANIIRRISCQKLRY